MIRWLKWMLLGECDHYRMKDVASVEEDCLVIICARCLDTDILWTNNEVDVGITHLGRPA